MPQWFLSVERFGDKRQAPKATVRFIAMLGVATLGIHLLSNQLGKFDWGQHSRIEIRNRSRKARNLSVVDTHRKNPALVALKVTTQSKLLLMIWPSLFCVSP